MSAGALLANNSDFRYFVNLATAKLATIEPELKGLPFDAYHGLARAEEEIAMIKVHK